MKAEHLKLSKVKKVELFDFMKETRNKEEYRRASAIKQKLEGLPYRTIARNLDVNYRNVYNWIKEYKEYGLDGIRSKRNNAGRIPKISSDKNKQMIKEIISKSPRTYMNTLPDRSVTHVGKLYCHLCKEVQQLIFRSWAG